MSLIRRMPHESTSVMEFNSLQFTASCQDPFVVLETMKAGDPQSESKWPIQPHSKNWSVMVFSASNVSPVRANSFGGIVCRL